MKEPVPFWACLVIANVHIAANAFFIGAVWLVIAMVMLALDRWARA